MAAGGSAIIHVCLTIIMKVSRHHWTNIARYTKSVFWISDKKIKTTFNECLTG